MDTNSIRPHVSDPKGIERNFATIREILKNLVVPITRSIIAGNGLSGGGTLDDDVTVDIEAGGVDTDELADDAVTNAKIADNAVDTDQLADDAVTAAKLDETGDYTVAGLTDSGLTASRLVGTDGTKKLTSENISSWIAGTENRVTVTNDGDGTATLSGPQDMATDSSPTFAGLTLSGLTASRLMAANGSKAAESVSDLTSWIGGTSNRVTVANDGDGTVTLSGPQDLAAASSPTFNGLTLTSVTIGANTLNTDEFACLDGQNQAVKTSSSPTFVDVNATGKLLESGNYQGVSTEGLLALWHFMSTKALDASVVGDTFADWSGNNEMLTSYTYGLTKNGKYGRGVYLEVASGNGYLRTSLTDIGGTYGGGELTYAGWYKTSNTTATYMGMMGFQKTTGNTQSVRFYLHSGKPEIVIKGDDATAYYVLTANTAINDGKWHLVVVTIPAWNSATRTISIYIDGVLDNTGTDTRTASSVYAGYFYAGKHPGASYYWDGTIDEMSVWSRQLSAEEVRALYMQRSELAGLVSDQQTKTTSSPTFANLVLATGGDIRPSSNSTTAINIAQADGTNFVVADSTNKRLCVGGASAPSYPLDVTGSGRFTGDLYVDGGDIGLTTDTDLIQIAANSVTINGALTVAGAGEIGGTSKTLPWNENQTVPTALWANTVYASAGPTNMTATKGYLMARAGSITEISLCYELAATGSVTTLVVEVRKNDSVVWSNSIQKTTGAGIKEYFTQARNADAFVADDVISISFTATGGDAINNYVLISAVIGTFGFYYDA